MKMVPGGRVELLDQPPHIVIMAIGFTDRREDRPAKSYRSNGT
jgi:hypothetical protein